MPTRAEILRALKSRDTVYEEDFDAVLGYVDGQESGATVGMQWRFSTATADADPGAGRVRYNNAVPASVTALILSDFTDGNIDVSNILALLTTGHRIYIQQQSAGTAALSLNVSGPAVDNTTHFTVPVTVVGSGILPANNAKMFMLAIS